MITFAPHFATNNNDRIGISKERVDMRIYPTMNNVDWTSDGAVLGPFSCPQKSFC